MSFKRFTAASAREALDRVRRELGDEAVILSNKKLGPGRIEIIAAAPDAMQALVDEVEPASRRAPRAADARAFPASRPAPESFQEFIRRQSAASPRAPGGENGAATRHDPPGGVAMYHEVARAPVEAPPPAARSAGRAAETSAALRPEAPPAVFRRRPSRLEEPDVGAETPPADPQPVAPSHAEHALEAPAAAAGPSALPSGLSIAPPAAPPAASATIAAATAAAIPPGAATAAPSTATAATQAAVAAAAPPPAPILTMPDARVMAELHSLRSALAQRIETLETKLASTIAGASQPAASAAPSARSPGMVRTMTRLLMSGFSPEVARRIGEHAPANADPMMAEQWLHEVVAANIDCTPASGNPLHGPGAIALVGPTGVGKTTTIAKLAARFAVRYGAAQLGLVTLDSYRIGAHEQLRSYGRILGVPVHIAQDGATLRELLASLQGRRLVLIDTCGISQRDERLGEMLGMLEAARFGGQPVQRVLLLNAASHAETLEEVARAWQASEAGGAILTKLDEAARIGGALDCLLRWRFALLGLTNGQRVPEDWHAGNPQLLAHIALKPSGAAFALDGDEAVAWSSPLPGGASAVSNHA
jgi:flagellar biosynthesis protein FlhF